MSHIQQKSSLGASIPTPSANYGNFFIEDTTYLPKVKLPSGTIIDLVGPIGATGPTGPINNSDYTNTFLLMGA